MLVELPRARATSAAPYYFKEFVKEETKTMYADGGIHHNCPVWVANVERKLLWPDCSNRDPDVFLSIGTGCSESTSKRDPRGHSFEGLKNVGLMSKMWKIAHEIIDNHTNCEGKWNEYYRTQVTTPQGRRRNIRFNVTFNTPRPPLDEVSKLDELEQQATIYVKQRSQQIREIAHWLIASCFYFEKNGRCTLEGDVYKLSGMYGPGRPLGP